MTLFLIFCLFYHVIDAKSDSITYKTNLIEHNWDSINKLLVFVFIGYSIYKPPVILYNMSEIILLIFIGLGTRWLIFDLVFNIFAELPYNYYGTTSIIDRLTRNRKINIDGNRINLPIRQSLKFLTLFLVIISIIYFYK